MSGHCAARSLDGGAQRRPRVYLTERPPPPPSKTTTRASFRPPRYEPNTHTTWTTRGRGRRREARYGSSVWCYFVFLRWMIQSYMILTLVTLAFVVTHVLALLSRGTAALQNVRRTVRRQFTDFSLSLRTCLTSTRRGHRMRMSYKNKRDTISSDLLTSGVRRNRRRPAGTSRSARGRDSN